MSLRSVMIHRARVLRRVSTGDEVEGREMFETALGEWFRCRLFPDETPETDGVRGGRRLLSKKPHVVYDRRYLNGTTINPRDITPGDQVEIEAGILGHQLWQVGSEPQPLQRGRGQLIAFYFTVSRLETAGADGGSSVIVSGLTSRSAFGDPDAV